jgi:hypothetical protein
MMTQAVFLREILFTLPIAYPLTLLFIGGRTWHFTLPVLVYTISQ